MGARTRTHTASSFCKNHGDKTHLDLCLDLISKRSDSFRSDLRLWQLVQGLLKVGHRDHCTERKHLVRVVGAEVALDKLPRDWLAIPVPGVPSPPSSITHERVEKHGLELSIRDAGGSTLLCKQRRWLLDIGKVRRVSRLVHQRSERCMPRPVARGSMSWHEWLERRPKTRGNWATPA